MSFPTVASVSRGRDNNFNLIRMIAATTVLVSHAFLVSWGEGWAPFHTLFNGINLGTMAVLVFFALSGFFIAKSFDAGGSWRRFLWARLLRLCPANLVTAALTVILGGLVLTTVAPADYWPEGLYFFLRQASLVSPLYELPGVFSSNPFGPTVNSSIWTLFYEALCYAGVFALGMTGHLRRGPVMIWVLVGLVALSLLSQYVELPGRLANVALLFPPFAIGAALYLWRDRLTLNPYVALGSAVLAYLAHGTAVFPLLLSLALGYGAFVVGFWKWPPLLAYNRLGDYSYGMYIYAFPIQQIVAMWGVTNPFVNIALSLPMTLACAVVSWTLVEKPALARVKHVS